MKTGQLNSIGNLRGTADEALEISGWALTIGDLVHVFLLESEKVHADDIYKSLNKITSLLAKDNEHISHPCKDVKVVVHSYPTILKATSAALSMATTLDQVRGWNLTYEAMCMEKVQNDYGMVVLENPVEGMSWRPVAIHKTSPGGIPLPPWKNIVEWGLPTKTEFKDTMKAYAIHLTANQLPYPKTFRFDVALESHLKIVMDSLKVLSPESGIKWWMDVATRNHVDIIALSIIYSNFTVMFEEAMELEF